MRTRNRSNLLTLDALSAVNRFRQKYYRVSDGALLNEYYLPASNKILVKESDVDEIVDDPSSSRAAKQVKHTTRIKKQTLSAQDTLISGNDKYITDDLVGNAAHYRVWGLYGDIFPEHIQINWDKTDRDLMFETLDAFYTLNDVDTLLNTVEAPQFVTSIQSLYNRVKAPVYADMKAAKVQRRKKAAAVLSGGFLYYAFGVAPVINDMRKIAKAGSSYSKKLAKALSNAGRNYSVHRRCGGSFNPVLTGGNGMPLPTGYGPSVDAISHWHADIQKISAPIKICTVRGIRDHKYLTSGFQELDYLMSRFGATGPASFAWERIPFSFVVDWFIDVSGVLHRLDNYLTGSRKKIQDATISYKWACAAGAIKHVRLPDISSFDGFQMCTNELHSYHRKPMSTDIYTSSTQGRFGKYQIAETAALIGQMAANLKTKRRF